MPRNTLALSYSPGLPPLDSASNNVHMFYVCFSYIKFSEIVLFCWVWNSDSSLTAVAVKTKLLEMLLLWDVTLPVTVCYNCAPCNYWCDVVLLHLDGDYRIWFKPHWTKQLINWRLDKAVLFTIRVITPNKTWLSLLLCLLNVCYFLLWWVSHLVGDN